MRRSAVLLSVLGFASLAAVEPAGSSPLLVQVGGTYLSGDLRQALHTDWGYAAGVAALLAESGFMGVPSLDIDTRYAPDGEGSLLTFEATYAERSLVGERYWLGVGLGSNFVRLKLDKTGDRAAASDSRWTVGGKAMIGYLLSDRLFIEGTYHYTRKIMDMDSSSATVAIGYWF
jgi:hypothetical protein